MKKILVCHTGAWIGDMVLLTPTLRALKQKYSLSHVTILLRPHVADLMKANPYVDSCMIDKKQEGLFTSLIRLSKKIKNENYDIAVVLHPTSFRNALLPFLAGVPLRIGLKNNGRGLLVTASCPVKHNIHEVQRYLNVFSLLNYQSSSDSSNHINPKLEYWHTDAERNTVEKLLLKEGVSKSERLIAVNIGTTWQTKQWDVEKFALVIKEITNKVQNATIVITGSETEKFLVEKLPISKSVVNFVGKINILQLGALLERSEVCLTCDSGPMHIAAAVGTTCVALFGPTDPIRHQPYGNGHDVIEKPVSCRPCYKRRCYRKDIPYLCMKEIKTSEVIEKLVKKLNLTKSKIHT